MGIITFFRRPLEVSEDFEAEKFPWLLKTLKNRRRFLLSVSLKSNSSGVGQENSHKKIWLFRC